MGSLNLDGTLKLQSNNSLSARHQGNFLTTASSNDATLETNATSISNSGTIRRTNSDLIGVVWQPGGTAATSGLTKDMRDADNSVERQKFTANGQEAGNLQHDVVRKITGVHVSISNRQAIVDPVAANQSGLAGGDALGAMQTISERKVFFLPEDRGINGAAPSFSDWTIFDSSGDAVGPGDGTTDVDITPNEGLIGK